MQDQGIRIICRLKGRGVTKAKEKLEELSREEAHPTLCLFYDGIVNQLSARSQFRNEPRAISTTGNCCYNTFLPCTI